MIVTDGGGCDVNSDNGDDNDRNPFHVLFHENYLLQACSFDPYACVLYLDSFDLPQQCHQFFVSSLVDECHPSCSFFVRFSALSKPNFYMSYSRWQSNLNHTILSQPQKRHDWINPIHIEQVFHFDEYSDRFTSNIPLDKITQLHR